MDPFPNRIISSGEVARVVGVQTFHADPCPTDATRWARSVMVVGDECVAFRRGAGMNVRDQIKPELRFGLVHTATRFEGADATVEVGIDQPVARRHGSAVGHEGLVEDDGRMAIGCSSGNHPLPAGGPTERSGHRVDVGRGW